MPWGLFALNNRSIFRAFNFLVVPEPAVTKREESTIRLCCLGGFHGHHRLLGLNSPLSSLAPWCEMLKTLMESFQASLPIRSTIRFLSEPPVIVKSPTTLRPVGWTAALSTVPAKPSIPVMLAKGLDRGLKKPHWLLVFKPTAAGVTQLRAH